MIKLKDLIKKECGCGDSCCTVKESVNEKVDKIGAIKKAFPWAKGKMMNVIQMAIEMDVDGLAGVIKNYKANPAAYKQFVRDMSKMRGLPGLEESINEANPEAMVGKKLGALLKSLDKTIAQYKKNQ